MLDLHRNNLISYTNERILKRDDPLYLSEFVYNECMSLVTAYAN